MENKKWKLIIFPSCNEYNTCIITSMVHGVGSHTEPLLTQSAHQALTLAEAQVGSYTSDIIIFRPALQKNCAVSSLSEVQVILFYSAHTQFLISYYHSYFYHYPLEHEYFFTTVHAVLSTGSVEAVRLVQFWLDRSKNGASRWASTVRTLEDYITEC